MMALAQNSRTVLGADPPALILAPSLGCGHLQSFSGFPLLDLFLGVEAREVLADDLFSFVALDVFGPRVPSDNPPFGVEPEDGVVPHAFNEQAEPLFADRNVSSARLRS